MGNGGARDDDRRRDQQPSHSQRESRENRDSGRDSKGQTHTWDYRDSANSKRDDPRESKNPREEAQSWDYRASTASKRDSRDARQTGRDGADNTWDYRDSAKRDTPAKPTPPWRK